MLITKKNYIKQYINTKKIQKKMLIKIVEIVSM